jgi:hypothetical protein
MKKPENKAAKAAKRRLSGKRTVRKPHAITIRHGRPFGNYAVYHDNDETPHILTSLAQLQNHVRDYMAPDESEPEEGESEGEAGEQQE